MEQLNFLEKLGRVKAPSDFEQRVMRRLAQVKRAKAPAAVFGLRLSLAGALAGLLVCFILVNIFVLRRPETQEVREGESGPGTGASGAVRSSEVIPVMESLNYTREVRGLSAEPDTIYILESVSDDTYRGIRY